MAESTTGRRKPWGESNPLLVKELRGRMRGARAFVVLTIYLLLLGCFVSLIYATIVESYSFRFPTSADMAEVGRAIFYAVSIIQLFVVTFITPAFTAGSISGERERKTYELLRTTLLSARRLVSGKLFATLTYSLLLILAAVPLQGLAFMLGGVTMEQLALILLVLAMTAFFFGVVGILFSAILRKTSTATALVYGIALLLTVGLPLVLLLFTGLFGIVLLDHGGERIPFVLRVILIYSAYFIVNLSPVGAAVTTEMILVEESSLWFFQLDVWNGGGSTFIPLPSGWIIYTLAYLVLGLVLLRLTIRQVQRQETQ
ncbi:MAG: ABC transporter permease [Anaerolineae bacterium]|nr:ABC transporter permease [Anaerolineae bacterium]